jgi:class 3 adenylate cyclase
LSAGKSRGRRAGEALLAGLTAIRDAGTAGKDQETARRLQAINVILLCAIVLSSGYCLFYAVYDWRLFAAEIIFLMCMAALYAAIFALTGTGRVEAAMWATILVALTHIGVISWMLGPDAGVLAYLLVVPFVVTLIIRQGDRRTIGIVVVAVTAIFAIVRFGGHEGTYDQMPEIIRQVFVAANLLGAVVVASVISLFVRWLIARAETGLRLEQARTDRLLRAILPESVAEQLKEDRDRTVAEYRPEATVLLADIVGFTRRSMEVPPPQLVDELNMLFTRFDGIAEQHGVERIKTIGDGYLAVCGLPEPHPDHCVRMARFALAARAAADALAADIWPGLALRTAIHTGPVVAGVIGRTKFAYDVWGDTVNTVARMEEICPPGAILVSAETARWLASHFALGPPVTEHLRDRGEMTLRTLDGPAPPQPSGSPASRNRPT